MGQLVFYVKHLLARQSNSFTREYNVTALWLVINGGEKNKLIIMKLGSRQGKKAFLSFIY